MREYAERTRRRGRTLALVPTMGFLHRGHLSLVRKARRLADTTVVSLYVNPAQFGPGEDFARYPRDLKNDRRLLAREGVGALFAPSNLYAADHATLVDPGPRQSLLCGAFRPGHFQGVATVVLKLLNIIRPDVAVFGQKDAQQYLILRQMVRDLDLPVRLVMAPIVREPDGLALSSRNAYLTPAERALAPSLYRALAFLRGEYRRGRRDARTLLARARRLVRGRLDYLSAVEIPSLKPVARLKRGTLVAGAMRLGRARLIDNLILP
jgi:pantoate--beta-alanine ligase